MVPVWRDIVEVWQSVLDVLNAPLTEVDGKTLSPMSAIQIVVILIVTIVVTGRLRSLTRHLLIRRVGTPERVAGIASRAVGALSLFTGVYIGLTSVGFDLNVLVAILGGLSVGIAFGTQDIARNLISGVIVSAERKITAGSDIEIRGYRGHVEEVGPRSVQIQMEDGRRVIVPSVLFLSQPVVLFDDVVPDEQEDSEQSE